MTFPTLRTSFGVGCISLSLGALAQENILRPLPGARELGITGNWTQTGSARVYDVVVEGGYYVTASLAAVALFGIEKHSPQVLEYFIGAKYEFQTKGQTVPYLLAGVESHRGSASSTGPVSPRILDPAAGPNATFYEAGVGVNYFVGRETAVFAELAAFKTNHEPAGTDFQIGLRFFFK